MADLHQQLHAAVVRDVVAQGVSTGKALRVVIELHKPEMFGGFMACLACSPGMPPQVLIQAPCPTVQAIARELGVQEDNHHGR